MESWLRKWFECVTGELGPASISLSLPGLQHEKLLKKKKFGYWILTGLKFGYWILTGLTARNFGQNDWYQLGEGELHCQMVLHMQNS